MPDDVYGGPPSPEAVAALVAVLGLAIDRYIRNRARRTIAENAKADPAKPKCRWVVGADACEFCKQRGSFFVEPGQAVADSHCGCKCCLSVVFGKVSSFIKGKVEERRTRKREEALSNEKFFGKHKTPVGKVNIDSTQFGHKSRTYMKDYGLDESSPEDRMLFRGIVYDTITDPDCVKKGSYYGDTTYQAFFFIKGNDATVVKAETGEYVSIFKGGVKKNAYVKSARVVIERRPRNP